ncbi:MAG TPA: ABC transporter permease, partial [Tissierellaceae bacterium]
MFSFMFIGYATSLFIKSRGKEFGLLSLYGMTKKQIRKYVFIENSIISLFSILIGITLGALLSKLFLMMMDRFISVGLYLYISPLAVVVTIVLFIVIFQIINFLTLLKINNKEIVEQLKSNRKPRTLKTFSKAKAMLGIFLLVLGYVSAWIVYGGFVVLALIPVTITVIVGTYFFVTQFSLYFVDKLNKNKRLKYSGTNIVSFSQLSYKLQDTAKVLFLASILGAITFTATETIFTFYKEVDHIMGHTSEEDVLIGNFESKDTYELIREKVRKEISKDTNIIDEYELEFIKALNLSADEKYDTRIDTTLISESDYNKAAKMYGYDELKLDKNQVYYVYPHKRMGMGKEYDNLVRNPGNIVEIEVEGYENEYEVIGERVTAAITIYSVGRHDYYVVNDEDFNNLLDKSNQTNISNLNGFKVESKYKSYNTSKELWKTLGKEEGYTMNLYFKAINHVDTRNSFGIILFIGFFISFLFFLATGSIIYFKLFDEIKQDREEYLILRKIGITNKELNKIITKQIGLVFFIPFVISTVHSFFAL